MSKKKSKEHNGKTIKAGALRGLPWGEPVPGPPHRQRRDPRLGFRDKTDPNKNTFEATPYDVAYIIVTTNIGGDAWSSRILLEEIGLRVIAQWSGDGTIAELENTPRPAQRAALLPLDELTVAMDPPGRAPTLRPQHD